MHKIACSIAVFWGLFSVGVAVYAFDMPDRPTSYVSDYAGILSQEAKADLEQSLSSFTASTTSEIAVVTIPDLGGDTIEHYAVKLFEKWKIGTAKNDNGVLLLVAVKDKKVRIEVGYGLEGALPDIVTKDIIDTKITPAFKEGDYNKGIQEGVLSIIEVTQGEYHTTKQQGFIKGNVLEMIFFGLIIGIQFFSAIFARSKSWWAGGVLGGVAGIVLTGFGVLGLTLITGAAISIFLVLLGLLFDYIVSSTYSSSVRSGSSIPWWAGGGSSGSGGGSFGGFSGGSSGGGGSSGSW